jgi:hypothetical protein
MRCKSTLLVFLGLAATASPVLAGCGPTAAQFHSRALTAMSATQGSLKPDAEAQPPEFFNIDLPHAPIVGLWDIKFMDGSQVVDEGFDAWHSDGTETLNDTPPPVTGNVCLGVWTQTGRNTFKLKHPSWVYDEATNTQIVGQAIIRETVTVSRDGNSFSGTSTIDIIDTFGNP